MPVNHYFQDGNGIGNTAEKRLYEDLIIEGLKIYGQDVYYLPRTIVNRDLILGEDMLSKFSSALLLEAYMETTEGFAGEQEIVNKFGLEIREDTTFTDVNDDLFLKRYVTALFKKQWGANLSKFNGVAMLGGVTLNGQQIYSEALSDIEKLETELRTTYELNPALMIG